MSGYPMRANSTCIAVPLIVVTAADLLFTLTPSACSCTLPLILLKDRIGNYRPRRHMLGCSSSWVSPTLRLSICGPRRCMPRPQRRCLRSIIFCWSGRWVSALPYGEIFQLAVCSPDRPLSSHPGYSCSFTRQNRRTRLLRLGRQWVLWPHETYPIPTFPEPLK